MEVETDIAQKTDTIFDIDAFVYEQSARSGALEVISELATLDHLAGPLQVHSDVSLKSFGFPSGLAMLTQGDWLYPLAAPDLGCGYCLVDTGCVVDGDVPRDVLDGLLSDLQRQVGTDSPHRRPIVQPIRSILEAGSGSIAAPSTFTLSDSELQNSWDASAEQFTDAELGFVAAHMGAATGHFIAITRTRDDSFGPLLPAGRILVLIHTGAAPIREVLHRKRYYPYLADLAIKNSSADPSGAARGYFPLNLSTRPGRVFLGTAMAARNFGMTNRRIVADRVVPIVTRHLGSRSGDTPREIFNTDHVAYEKHQGMVRSRRGLQMAGAGMPFYFAGGGFSSAFLCLAHQDSGPKPKMFPHGCTVPPPEVVSWLLEEAILSPPLNALDQAVSNVPLDVNQREVDILNTRMALQFLSTSRSVGSFCELQLLVNFRDRG